MRADLEPLTIAAAYISTSVAATVRDPSTAMEFNAAIALGGVVTLLFSLRKARKKKSDGIDTALAAAIGFIGSMALAYFVSPALEGRTFPGTDIAITLPLAGFLISVSAAPFIEWMLEGGPLKIAKHIAVKAGWISETECEAKP